ncbi:nucleolin-like [Gadus macrocephalus]|uniref:nucleolin-like n=1 Tax=Gadus macrocephalus TaxID=80720 RepID=UPI0028CB15C9|nr:nucleolin-like [Gadus macrocephalus]
MVVTMMASAEIVVPEEEKPKAEEAGVTVDGKRKAESEDTICPTKKLKTVNEGFCVFIGNLNKTKSYEEIKTSILSYLLKESLLVQDIRLHADRTFAYVDLATEIDMAKALTLNGKKVLDLPLRISKAKVKVKEDKKRKRAKPTAEQKADKFAKWLSVTNLPHNATKAEVMGIFKTAVDVTFPGGTSGPTRGIAVLHFETKELAEKAMKKKKGKKLRDRVIKINAYRCKNNGSVDDENTEAIVQGGAPTNTLVIKNLPRLESETKLKKIFKNAVGINVPMDGSNARGFAFVEFKTDKEAKDAMEMARGVKILKKAIDVEYSRTKLRPEADEVLLTTLIVTGLDKKTSEETLATMFEGCTTTRIIRDKKTSTSKGFGFVDFAKKEDCQAAKESMEDCEIDGKKLTLAYAKPQFTQPTQKPKTQPSVQSAEKAKVQPKQKPGSQPKKPVSKDQPSAGKTKPSKRIRNKKKGNVEMNLGFFSDLFDHKKL